MGAQDRVTIRPDFPGHVWLFGPQIPVREEFPKSRKMSGKIGRHGSRAALTERGMGKRVALVLAGCGVFDGSEVHEASAALVHLSRGGAQVRIFAPNIEQMHVVDHFRGSPTEEKRNVLVESARLARGNIEDLAELKVGEFDAVIFPGGFGVAKNLCSWPIGLFPDAETASAIVELGCKHICKDVTESHVDATNKIVTTCAFMCKAPLHEIFDGVGTMVAEVLKLTKTGK
uniref:Uncharacterized protein n=1 Tax=Chrysemys picta bellii TaxID=8478 RepID=A0A8C3ISK5_CHRPI